MGRKDNLGANGKLQPDEFGHFVNDLISSMRAGLPTVAKRFFGEKGRGAICLHLQDAEKANDRRMGIGYITPDKLPDHRYLKQVVQEYDPEKELVIWATSGPGIQFVRHVTFEELLAE